jgi:hypothetical protein
MKFLLLKSKFEWTSEQGCSVGIQSERAYSYGSQLVVTKVTVAQAINSGQNLSI